MKPNTASYNNSSWHTDTDGFLEHSPSGGSLWYKGPDLQEIIPGFFVCVLPHVCALCVWIYILFTCIYMYIAHGPYLKSKNQLIVVDSIFCIFQKRN